MTKLEFGLSLLSSFLLIFTILLSIKIYNVLLRIYQIEGLAKKKLEKHKDEGLSEAYIEAISCLNVTQELIKIAEK